MHVDVSHILNQEEGASVDFEIDGEQPEFEDIELTQPLSGQIRLMRSEDGLLASGELQTSIQLECHRCLRTFDQKLKFPVQAVFRQHPAEDEFSISSRGMIDLAKPVRQEIIVHLPHQQLCEEDCAGIEKVKEIHGRP